jgi:hypothetical protein
VARLFLPQTTLEEWALAEQADVREGKLVITGESGSYPVSGAVHFKLVVSGEDGQGLIGKVKTPDQLERIGAEQMMESVLLGETAYEVEQGYLVTTPDVVEAPKAAQTDADLLAAFLLEKKP